MSDKEGMTKTAEGSMKGLSIDDKPVHAHRSRDSEFDTLVKKIFEQYTASERAFFLNLSDSDHAILGKAAGNHDTEHNPNTPFAQRKHIKVLLTLKGLKPCTLFSPISHTSDPRSNKIIDRLVKKVFKPIMDDHKLEAYGFTLRKIKHPIPYTDNDDNYFQDQWIFADMRSEHWELVESIFFIPHPGKKTSRLDVGKAFGYPIISSADPAGFIQYNDLTEKEKLQQAGAGNLPFVMSLVYFAPGAEEDCAAILAHFKKCRDAVASVGHRLGISTLDHPMVIVQDVADPSLMDERTANAIHILHENGCHCHCPADEHEHEHGHEDEDEEGKGVEHMTPLMYATMVQWMELVMRGD